MTATNAMLAHRYGYGLGRGPRRMPPRMQTSLMGTESYGSTEEAVAADMFGDAEMDRMEMEASEDEARGRVEIARQAAISSLPPRAAVVIRSSGGSDVRAADRMAHREAMKSSVRATTGKIGSFFRMPKTGDLSEKVSGIVAAEMFGADDEEPDDADADEGGDGGGDEGGEGEEKKGFKMPKLPGWALPAAAIAAGTAGAVGLGLALTSKKRKAKRAEREASEEMGSIVASEMFGADDEDADAEDADADEGGDEGGEEGEEKKGFKMPKLPGWALPAAAIAAGTAGAVGLGLALTSKKRKAKRAEREAAEAMGAMGDEVVASMFGDPEDDEFEDYGDDPSSFRWSDPAFDPFAPPAPSLPPTAPPVATANPVNKPAGMPSWHQYKAAQRDVYRATKQSTKASDRLAKAQAGVPVLSTPFGGMHRQRYGWNMPKIPSPLSFSNAQELQSFLGDLASQGPADLNWIATRLVVGELGLGTASSNQSRFTAQFDKFKAAVLREGGMGPAATAEANAGVSLVGQVKGSQVSPLNRQAMLSVSKATAPFIVRGLV